MKTWGNGAEGEVKTRGHGGEVEVKTRGNGAERERELKTWDARTLGLRCEVLDVLRPNDVSMNMPSIYSFPIFFYMPKQKRILLIR